MGQAGESFARSRGWPVIMNTVIDAYEDATS